MRFPNVPLLPPIAAVPLYVMLPVPLWVALLVKEVVTVTVLPPSAKVPEVKVNVLRLAGSIGLVLPARVSVPALLFTTIAVFVRADMVPLLVNVWAPEPLKVNVLVAEVNVVDVLTVKFPPTVRLLLLVKKVGVLPVIIAKLF